MRGRSSPDTTDRQDNERLILRPLVERLRETAALPVQRERKRLWADHQALRKTPKIPVCVYYEGIPTPQWETMLGRDPLACRTEPARSIEWDLRRLLWMSDNVPDDHIVWPSIIIDAVTARQEEWGVPLAWEGSRAGVDDPLEARRIVAPLQQGIDMRRLRFTDLEVDVPATREREAQARQLVGDGVAIHVRWPDLGHSPFDLAARLCGLENLLLLCADDPKLVRELMMLLTSAHVAHHERRAREGRVNLFREGPYARVGFRVHCWCPGEPDASRAATLADEWAYVSAQTSSGLGPRHYEELVQPASEVLAAPFTRGTVYYHGCECLDAKVGSIARIPNLRRFHVSPWSSLEAAIERLDGSVVYEVHANPAEVLFGATREDIRLNLQRLAEEGQGITMDLNLSDIHSVGGRPEQLAAWAREAQEVAVL